MNGIFVTVISTYFKIFFYAHNIDISTDRNIYVL